MTINIEILGLQTTGDGVSVKGQGRAKRSAQWRRWEVWEFTVPSYIGKHYRIGNYLKIKVMPCPGKPS